MESHYLVLSQQKLDYSSPIGKLLFKSFCVEIHYVVANNTPHFYCSVIHHLSLE